MKQIHFFALKEDLVPVLELVESKGRLKYILMGNFLKHEFKDGNGFYAGAEIANLGAATAESSISCEDFLVSEAETPINLRTFRASDGRERVCVDQLANPDSVTFTPGGIWNEDVLLSGRIATASDLSISQALMKRFHSAIRKTFSKVKAFYVGPQALALLENGKRLTQAVQSPREYDLTP